MDSAYFDNLERSLAAHLTAALSPTDGTNVKPGRRAGLVEPRPAIGITWTAWTPNRSQWGGTTLDVTLRIVCYSVKSADEQEDHREEGRVHLATLLALTDQDGVDVFDYRQDPPRLLGRRRIEWLGGVNPPDSQARSRSETSFDVLVRTQEE